MFTIKPTLRERQRLTTKAEIVRIAFELFAKQGYDQVSVEMIAAAAGVSRATFFNYFPKKDLILHELAAARAARIKQMAADLRQESGTCTREDLTGMILEICRENARFSLKSKNLLLGAIMQQISAGLLLTQREKAVGVLAEILGSLMCDDKAGRLAAESLFCIVLSTMLEWLMREDVPERWLGDTMQARVEMLLTAVPPSNAAS